MLVRGAASCRDPDRFVTVGGAIAADIHGKNHHRDGSFCTHVTSMTLATPTGVSTVTPNSDPRAVLGHGRRDGSHRRRARTSALPPLETLHMVVDTEHRPRPRRPHGKDDRGDAGYRYSVAWIDCLAHDSAWVAPPAADRRPPWTTCLPTDTATPAGSSTPVRVEVPVAPVGPLEPAQRGGVQRDVVPQGAAGAAARSCPWPASSTPSTASAPGTSSTAGRGSSNTSSSCCFGAEATVRSVLERFSGQAASFLAVLKRSPPTQTTAVVPVRGLDARPGPPRGGSPASPGSSTGSTRRSPAPEGGCTWPRTADCAPGLLDDVPAPERESTTQYTTGRP